MNKMGKITYQPISKDIKISEWCSVCEEEVIINTHYHQQICPNCGAFIKPCANCIKDKVECHECPLDILNNEEE